MPAMKKETSINDLSADLLQKIMKMYLNSMSPKGAERNQNLSRERYESHLILTKLQPVCRWWARVGFGLPQLNEPLQKVARALSGLGNEQNSTNCAALLSDPKLLFGLPLSMLIRGLFYRGERISMTKKDHSEDSDWRAISKKIAGNMSHPTPDTACGIVLMSRYAEYLYDVERGATAVTVPPPTNIRLRQSSVFFNPRMAHKLAAIMQELKDLVFRDARSRTRKYNPKKYHEALAKQGLRENFWLPDDLKGKETEKDAEENEKSAEDSEENDEEKKGKVEASKKSQNVGRKKRDKGSWGLQRNTMFRFHYAILNTTQFFIVKLIETWKGEKFIVRLALALAQFVGEMFNHDLLTPHIIQALLNWLIKEKHTELSVKAAIVILMTSGPFLQHEKYTERRFVERIPASKMNLPSGIRPRKNKRYGKREKKEQKVANHQNYIKKIREAAEGQWPDLCRVVDEIDPIIKMNDRMNRWFLHWAVFDFSIEEAKGQNKKSTDLQNQEKHLKQVKYFFESWLSVHISKVIERRNRPARPPNRNQPPVSQMKIDPAPSQQLLDSNSAPMEIDRGPRPSVAAATDFAGPNENFPGPSAISGDPSAISGGPSAGRMNHRQKQKQELSKTPKKRRQKCSRRSCKDKWVPLAVKNCSWIQIGKRSKAEFVKQIEEMMQHEKRDHVAIVFVILPNKSEGNVELKKMIAEVLKGSGFVSQFIQAQTVANKFVLPDEDPKMKWKKIEHMTFTIQKGVIEAVIRRKGRLMNFLLDRKAPPDSAVFSSQYLA